MPGDHLRVHRIRIGEESLQDVGQRAQERWGYEGRERRVQCGERAQRPTQRFIYTYLRNYTSTGSDLQISPDHVEEHQGGRGRHI